MFMPQKNAKRLLSLISLFLLIGTGRPLHSQKNEPSLSVVAILPLSGPAASFGQAVANGMNLALQDSEHIKVQFLDNQFLVKESVQLFRRAMALSKPDLIISIGASHSNAIAPLAEQNQILHLAASSDPACSRGRHYTFRTWNSGEDEGKQLARYLKGLELSRIALAISENDYHLAIQRGFESEIDAPMTLLQQKFPAESDIDFRPFLLKARVSDIQAIALLLHPGLPAKLSRQARELNFQPLFLSGLQLESSSERSAADGALKDAVFVSRYYSTAFKVTYLARYGNSDQLGLAALHYDLIHVLLDYTRQGKTSNLADFLLNYSPSHPSQAVLRFERGDNEVRLASQIRLRRVSSTGNDIEENI